MELNELILKADLKASEIVAQVGVSLSQATQWLTEDRNLSKPTIALLRLLCESKINGISLKENLTDKHIIKNAVNLDRFVLKGIYFLLDNNEIVYVGQSVNVYQRIHQHRDKKFNRIFVLKTDNLDLESYYINKLKPKYNSIILPVTKTPNKAKRKPERKPKEKTGPEPQAKISKADINVMNGTYIVKDDILYMGFLNGLFEINLKEINDVFFVGEHKYGIPKTIFGNSKSLIVEHPNFYLRDTKNKADSV